MRRAWIGIAALGLGWALPAAAGDRDQDEIRALRSVQRVERSELDRLQRGERARDYRATGRVDLDLLARQRDERRALRRVQRAEERALRRVQRVR